MKNVEWRQAKQTVMSGQQPFVLTQQIVQAPVIAYDVPGGRSRHPALGATSGPRI